MDAPLLPSGLRVGHWTDEKAATGCTVFLFDRGARAAVHRYAPATSTRHMDPLDATGSERAIHGLLFTGGSAFGLGASNGVMEVLAQRGIGVPTRGGRVPRVPAAVIHDLAIGSPGRWPQAEDAAAATIAASRERPREGNVGVGTGATLGKPLDLAQAMKGGFGVSLSTDAPSTQAPDPGTPPGTPTPPFLGVFVVVNALGDLLDPATGQIIAGCHEKTASGPRWLGPSIYNKIPRPRMSAEENTTLALIATDAKLSRDELRFVAQTASQALTRTLRPAGTPFDGDLVFAVSLATEGDGAAPRGQEPNAYVQLAYAASEHLERAMLRAVRHARASSGVPAACPPSDPHGQT